MLIDRRAGAVHWAARSARATRWAWCEITGGHEYGTWGAFMRRDTDLASKVRMECTRCGRGTAWVNVPTRGEPEEA